MENTEPKTYTTLESDERIVSVISGTLGLIDAIRGNKSVIQALSSGYLVFRGATGYCPLYNLIASKPGEEHKVHVETSVIVNRPRKEVYDYWRQVDNLPVFMKHLKSVIVNDSVTSEWQLKTPGDIGSVSWKSIIISDVRNEYIAWKSEPGSQIENSGVVQFIDMENNATGINVEIIYKAPFGSIGEALGKFLRHDLELIIQNDMERFKEYMETGKIPGIELPLAEKAIL